MPFLTTGLEFRRLALVRHGGELIEVDVIHAARCRVAGSRIHGEPDAGSQVDYQQYREVFAEHY